MLRQFLTIFVTMLIVIDPLGIVPMFLALSGGLSVEEKRRTIVKAVLTAFSVLALFIFAGGALLGFLGVLPGSFFVAGGILLFVIAIDMLLGKPRRTRSDTDPEQRSDIAIFPLGIPLLAGPGAITTILLYVSSSAQLLFTYLSLLVSVVITLGLAAAALLGSRGILRIMGKTGVSVVERVMGILIAALAVQFVYDGLVRLGVVG